MKYRRNILFESLSHRMSKITFTWFLWSGQMYISCSLWFVWSSNIYSYNNSSMFNIFTTVLIGLWVVASLILMHFLNWFALNIYHGRIWSQAWLNGTWWTRQCKLCDVRFEPLEGSRGQRLFAPITINRVLLDLNKYFPLRWMRKLTDLQCIMCITEVKLNWMQNKTPFHRNPKK